MGKEKELTRKDREELIVKSAQLARQGRVHPNADVRAMVPGLHEMINDHLDHLYPPEK